MRRNGGDPMFDRQYTVDEYHQMIRSAVLTEDDPIELLEGWLVSHPRNTPRHEYTVSITDHVIRTMLLPEWTTRIKCGMTTADSEPEPDIAVVLDLEYWDHHPYPEEVGLIAEVADGSLTIDRDCKRRLYARAGIVCYWIINIPERQVEVYTLPTGPAPTPGFQQCQIYRPGDAVPLTIGGQLLGTITVNDLLPRP
jgi:hypothetical protein